MSERLGLGGPTPRAVVNCQHKLRSREIQRRVVPEATPAFAPLEPRSGLRFPCFVKPVVGRLSDGATLARAPEDLAQLESDRSYAREYAAIAAHAGLGGAECAGFLAEEVLAGLEVTLEGFTYEGAVEVLGITDSVNYAGTSSFERFDYPTTLSEARCAELTAVANTLVPALELDASLFNIEFFVPDAGAAKIVEVNGRMASQFAPLLEHVHGRSSYEVLMDVALGARPRAAPALAGKFALSYCLRVFEDGLVEDVPEGVAGVELLVSSGELLSKQGTNDVGSFRLCIFEQTGADRAATVAAARARASELRQAFRIGPTTLARD
ncbi:MAG: ATP-grasp domain-containing protein [Gaiellaceae bacterium]